MLYIQYCVCVYVCVLPNIYISWEGEEKVKGKIESNK